MSILTANSIGKRIKFENTRTDLHTRERRQDDAVTELVCGPKFDGRGDAMRRPLVKLRFSLKGVYSPEWRAMHGIAPTHGQMGSSHDDEFGNGKDQHLFRDLKVKKRTRAILL